MDVARTLFTEQGFHRTGVAQIAAASGIKVGQIYRDFADKEAIVAAIVESDLAAFLQRHGNPYQRIGADDLSEVQLAIGSSGVPETFVIDETGKIAYQHIGDIRPEHVPLLLEKLAKLRR